MNDFQINFTVDGKEVTPKQIHEMELSRYHHVFKIFNEKGIEIKLNDRLIFG